VKPHLTRRCPSREDSPALWLAESATSAGSGFTPEAALCRWFAYLPPLVGRCFLLRLRAQRLWRALSEEIATRIMERAWR
jgi:hypothetical protein